MKPRRVSARPSGNRKPPGSTSSTGPDGDRHGPAPGPAGSALYGAIWDAVRRIPRGRVATYGQIAALAGRPGQPRLVGYALHHLPEGSKVPWHRVVNAQGKISWRPTGGFRLQRDRGLL